jgi:hypothetical protein
MRDVHNARTGAHVMTLTLDGHGAQEDVHLRILGAHARAVGRAPAVLRRLGSEERLQLRGALVRALAARRKVERLAHGELADVHVRLAHQRGGARRHEARQRAAVERDAAFDAQAGALGQAAGEHAHQRALAAPGRPEEQREAAGAQHTARVAQHGKGAQRCSTNMRRQQHAPQRLERRVQQRRPRRAAARRHHRGHAHVLEAHLSSR